MLNVAHRVAYAVILCNEKKRFVRDKYLLENKIRDML
jgi:hypothetical protein